MRENEIAEGVHYVRLGVNNAFSALVQMVEEGEQVIFR